MNVGYVCTNYNNSDYTRDAVLSLQRNTGHRFRIVVVDNNSHKESVGALKEVAREFANVELVLSGENHGYFRGLNLGIRRLRSTQPQVDLVVVGNNDLIFPPEFVDSLAANLSIFDKYAVVSPSIVTLDGVHQNPHVASEISPFREFIYGLYYANYYLAVAIRQIAKWTQSFTDRPDEARHDKGGEIYQGYGACYILGPVFFRHFEELWAPTFLMHEEIFLSKQLNERGLSVYYEPSIRVLHSCHGAMSAVPPRKAWEAGRNARRIFTEAMRNRSANCQAQK